VTRSSNFNLKNSKEISMGTDLPLAGQISLITGGSRGIGLAVARRLGAMGSKVAICARDRDRLGESAALLRREGVSTVLDVPADVAKADDVASLVEQVTQSLGPLDIVVNNAGVGVFGPGQDASEEDWDRVLGTNLKGVFLVCRAVAPGMIARRAGHVINISSLAGKNAFANGAVYCASKGSSRPRHPRQRGLSGLGAYRVRSPRRQRPIENASARRRGPRRSYARDPGPAKLCK
jgi:NADP-dependent 3-hydroxy acid dehydrogenase YdfG